MGAGKVVFLDFEFNQVSEPKVNLVCCATFESGTNRKRKFWLHKSPNTQATLREYLKQFDIVVGYACVAEARSFLALGLDPLEFKWVDEFIEYRMLTNHNDGLQWGKQLVDGKVKYVSKPKPKWERTEEEKGGGFKATHSLAEATYKLTGQIRDTAHKQKMRDLIISNPANFAAEERAAIMEYCLEDVVHLPQIWKRIKEEYRKLDPNAGMQEYFREAIVRGRYSAHTAIMESTGYPINVEATRNFSRQIPHILLECQSDINDQFPNINPFKWDKKKSAFTWNQKATREWVERHHDVGRWMKTDTGKLSLALEAFEKFYHYKHDYPRNNFGAQMVRFLKLKQHLYGFSDSGGKRKNFWDSVGSDGRVRPYMNIFGAQSSRSQPAASGFMFLKPAWMRSLVQPKPGRYCAGIDYGQQEFFVSALESGDKRMIEAYLSGDPYMYLAKLCGAVPKDGTREEYKKERDLFKSTVLGISYLMTKYGLASKLTADTGRVWTEDEAQEQIDMFYEAFPRLKEHQEELMEAYQDGCGIRLPCGWRMWNDNDNLRSVCNVPIQGFGASVMRKAVDNAVSRGCSVIFTLHDAIYIEGDYDNYAQEIASLYKSMREAFQYYYRDTEFYDVAGSIKLDPFAWGPNFPKDSEATIFIGKEAVNFPVSDLYIDERAKAEYERFSKYFTPPETDLL